MALPYRSGDDVDAYRLGARLAFLNAIETNAPHVAAELLDTVSGPYNNLADAIGDDVAPRFVPLHDLAPQHAEADAVCVALVAWATPYHLDERWVLDAALAHLWTVRRLGYAVPLGSLGASAYWVPAADVSPPRYNPDTETPAQYRARVDAYMAEVEARYTAEGWSEAQKKRSAIVHMEWLVLHHVLGRTYNAIGVGADESSVRRAIIDMYDLLPLTRRPAPNRH